MDHRLTFIFDIQPVHIRCTFDESAVEMSAHAQYKMVGWDLRCGVCHFHTFNIIVWDAVIECCQSEFIRIKSHVAVIDTCHRQKTEYADDHHQPDDSHDDMCLVIGDSIQLQIDNYAHQKDAGEKCTEKPYTQYRA